jgi:hypothetical protein
MLRENVNDHLVRPYEGESEVRPAEAKLIVDHLGELDLHFNELTAIIAPE